MLTRRKALYAGAAGIAVLALDRLVRPHDVKAATVYEVTHTDEEWHKLLTPAEYNITRQQGTELPESSPLTHLYARGIYRCVDCGLDLFKSDTKFDSGTGWPSFYAPILKNHVKEIADHSDGMDRTEVECARCGAHLGHVFNDGPQPTGLRYCMDGGALQFIPEKDLAAAKPAGGGK